MKQLDVPVRQWVPDWLGMICIFFIILPVTMLNGSYTGSMLEVSSTLGTNTEDITMGYYAASAGMAIAYPIVPKVLDALSSKFLLLTDLSIQFLLSWVCARSQNIDLVIICSFFIGFLKGFLMLWFIRRATKIFSPKNVRSEFYSYFYPLVFAGGQVSMIVTAELAYHYNWQYMYYFMMMMLMASILIVIVCFRHNRPLKPIRLSELHIREMLVIATGLLMLMYVINYGKVLDWTSSFKIRIYLVIAPILIAFFIWKQYHSKQPYVSLAPLYQPKSHRRLLLHDAGHVFQYLHHPADQLYDQHSEGGQYTHVPALHLSVAGICIGSIHLLLVVPLAALAFPLSDSRRHELFCSLFRNIVFHGFS